MSITTSLLNFCLYSVAIFAQWTTASGSSPLTWNIGAWAVLATSEGYGEDLAKGIVMLLDHENAKNNDFNLSTSESTSVLDLAEKIWKKLKPEKEFKYISTDPYEYDVQKRIPSTEKAKNLLGFEADTSLDEMLDIVIPWIKDAHTKGFY